MMKLSAEQLTAIARNYWRPDKDFDFRLEDSPERERFNQRWAQALNRMDNWGALLRVIGEELPAFTIGNITATCDACFRCGAYPDPRHQDRSTRWVVVGCLSILAPIYTVYGARFEYRGKRRIRDEVFFEPLPEQMQGPAQIIARKIEEAFEASRLPRELAETSIPLFVEPREPPETNLFHAFFIPDPERVP